MDLKFLGRGAASNPEEGATSAYFIDNNDLFLIDCGDGIYGKLVERNLLNHVNNIYLMVTHTHPDHFNGNLIINYYWGSNQEKKVNIILPKEPNHYNNIEGILQNSFCENTYTYIKESDLDNKYTEFQKIRYVETKHGNVPSYGLIFDTNKGLVYYSGDTNETSIIEKLIKSGKCIDKMFIDTTTLDFPGNVHLNIELLNSVIPDELKSRVWCMHFNKNKDSDINLQNRCMERARELGFHVVEIDRTKYKTKAKVKK